MSRPCPDHPRALGSKPNDCRECDREAAAIRELAKMRGANVRAALRDAPRPETTEPRTPDPIHDLALARKRADEQNARETRP